MPELLTKHPDVALDVLKSQGARCGAGLQPKILTSCPQEKLCVLRGGELCIYGPHELGLMTQLTRAEVCGHASPKAVVAAGEPAVGVGLAVVALVGVAVAVGRARRRGESRQIR